MHMHVQCDAAGRVVMQKCIHSVFSSIVAKQKEEGRCILCVTRFLQS